MPYKENKDLPDSVKGALPANGQDIFKNAFNSAYAKDSDEEKANQAAWGAVKNAGFEKGQDGKWSKKEKESFTVEDIEIFATGTWKGDTYDTGDLNEMVSNFKVLRDEIKPMLHIGHDRALENDGQPALGWLSDLKTNGQKLLATFTDVPKIVYNVIKKRLYTRVSSEIIWGLKHTGTNKKYGKVLTGVAIVGAAIPAVRTLQDLSVFTLNMDKRKVYEFDINDGKIGGDPMPDEDKMKKYIDDLNEANKRADEALEAAKKYKEELDKVEELRLTEKKQADIDSIKAYCEENVKSGSLAPAARDIILNDIDKKTYTENDKFSFTFDQVKDILDKQFTIDMDEKTTADEKTTGDNPESYINATIDKYMIDNKVSYVEAMTDLIKSDKTFAKAYTELKYSDE